MSLTEYTEGLYRLQFSEAQLEIAKAEEALVAAVEAHEAAKKRGGSRSSRVERFALDAAQCRKHVLVEFTRDKRIKELSLAIEIARGDELTSKEVWELEVSKEKRLEREIEACKIVAPRDGKLVYSYGAEGEKPRTGFKADGLPALWPYIEVQTRQLLFKIVPVEEPANSPK